MFKKIIQQAKQSAVETFKLLWQFKWYVCLDFVFILILLIEYFDPPAKDSPIWGSEAMAGYWNYINQEVYIQSCKYGLVISLLFILLGISNMRYNPKIAKLVFLFPLYIGWLSIL